MKVAMLTYSLRPRGGVVHALSLAEALSRNGAEVRLFSLKRKDTENGSTGFYRHTSVPFDIFDFEWNENTEERLKSMVNALVKNLPEDYDIYHAQDCVCDTALHTFKESGKTVRNHVRTVHHVEGFSDPFLNKCELAALSGRSAKITVSKYWQKKLREEYGLDSEVIHNGIDLRRFERIQGKMREPFILFVGGMEARKGLEFAIQTLEILTRRGQKLRLVAVAKPGFKQVETIAWFEHLIERCGVEGKVQILDDVSEDALLDLYSRASVFLLPTRMEGWGLAIMEAMAAKCPVVSAKVGGVTELIRNGKSGLLLDIGDIRGFADATEILLQNQELRNTLCDEAYETVKQYSWDFAAIKTLEFYEKLLNEQNR